MKDMHGVRVIEALRRAEAIDDDEAQEAVIELGKMDRDARPDRLAGLRPSHTFAIMAACARVAWSAVGTVDSWAFVGVVVAWFGLLIWETR